MTSDSTKQVLRKLDFPLCVKEALHRVGKQITLCAYSNPKTSSNPFILISTEQLCTANVTPNIERIQSIKQTDLAMELIAEFVFCDVDRKGAKKKVSYLNCTFIDDPYLISASLQRLTRIQEMQLLEVLSDYFAFSHGPNLGSDAARNTVFMSLFPHTFVERCQLLVKLVSIAVCTNNIPLLSATGEYSSKISNILF